MQTHYACRLVGTLVTRWQLLAWLQAKTSCATSATWTLPFDLASGDWTVSHTATAAALSIPKQNIKRVGRSKHQNANVTATKQSKQARIVPGQKARALSSCTKVGQHQQADKAQCTPQQ